MIKMPGSLAPIALTLALLLSYAAAEDEWQEDEWDDFYVPALMCSQASLLSSQGFSALGEWAWYAEPAAAVLWLIVVGCLCVPCCAFALLRGNRCLATRKATGSPGCASLLFICVVLGSMALATVLNEMNGGSSSRTNPEACGVDDASAVSGRLLAGGILAGVLCSAPVVALAILRACWCSKSDVEGVEGEAPPWSCSWPVSILMWILGMTFSGFCILYVMLYFANVATEEHDKWLMTAMFAIATAVLIMTAAVLILPFCLRASTKD